MSDVDICMLVNVSVNGGEVHKQNMTLESVILTMPHKIILHEPGVRQSS